MFKPFIFIYPIKLLSSVLLNLNLSERYTYKIGSNLQIHLDFANSLEYSSFLT